MGIKIEKLKELGFIKQGDYFYKDYLIHEGNFTLKIKIQNELTYKIIDNDTDLEYDLAYINKASGSFVGAIQEEVKEIIDYIKQEVFLKQPYQTIQANKIMDYLKNKYNLEAIYLWNDDNAVFKNNDGKWFAVLLKVNGSHFNLDSSIYEVINLKVKEVKELPGIIYKAYHMNKKHWCSIILNDRLSDDKLLKMIDESYRLVQKKKAF